MQKTDFRHLYTAAGKALDGQPWADAYPRPQLRRDSFINLNGWWDFTVSAADTLPDAYLERILVPYPPQSLLSGIHRDIPEGQFLFYRTTFSRPEGSGRLLLHIGAADQIAAVFLNGTQVGEHTGGYEAFSLDITDTVTDENTLVIRVVDHMSRCVLPYGKQRKKRGGMWYTPVSGIWQTVWLERVPETYIRRLHIRPEENGVRITADGVDSGTITVETRRAV